MNPDSPLSIFTLPEPMQASCVGPSEPSAARPEQTNPCDSRVLACSRLPERLATPLTTSGAPARVGPKWSAFIFADGNQRAPERYEGGAAKTVEMACHLARRGDVKRLHVAILSRENHKLRSKAFHTELTRLFLGLGYRARTTGALTEHGIRCEAYGDLASLYAGGECDADLAASVDVVCGLTRVVEEPRLTLGFDLLYPCSMLTDLDLPYLIRFGMEEPETVRLSGIDSHPYGLCGASTTLFPQVTMDEFDAMLDALTTAPLRVLRVGHGIEVIADIAQQLVVRQFPRPVAVTVPVVGSERAIHEALAAVRSALPSGALSVTYVPAGASPESLDQAPPRGASSLRLVAPSLCPQVLMREPSAALAPGQRGSIFTLGGMRLGYATVFGCHAGAVGLIHGIERAIQFVEKHPSTRGATRTPEVRTTAAEGEPVGVIEAWSDRMQELIDIAGKSGAPTVFDLAAVTGCRFEDRDWHSRADLFAALQLARATADGELLPSARWQRALFNYYLTAFYASVQPAMVGDALRSALAQAEAAATYMGLIALGDAAIFDHRFPLDTAVTWRPRLLAAADFLSASVEGRVEAAPAVEGREVLERIAAGWRRLRERFSERCHPEALLRFQCGLRRLYDASVAEYTPEVTRCPDVARWARGGHGRAEALAVLERAALSAPVSIAAHLQALLCSTETHPERVAEIEAEIRLFVYLLAVAPTIGASEFFRAAILARPSSEVSAKRLDVLEEALVPLDMLLRIQNDCSDIFRYSQGDRDRGKENSGTVLMPRGVSRLTRVRARIEARVTCERVMSRLEAWFRAAARRVLEVWPDMGSLLLRATQIGRGVYALSHYETVTRVQMSRLADELPPKLPR